MEGIYYSNIFQVFETPSELQAKIQIVIHYQNWILINLNWQSNELSLIFAESKELEPDSWSLMVLYFY